MRYRAWPDSSRAKASLIWLIGKCGGVLGNAPLVVPDREIGVTQTAVFDGDFNVLRLKRSEVNDLKPL